jgi:hypothetical protein
MKIMDLLAAGHITKGDVRKIAAALFSQDTVATAAFPEPYTVKLPDFNSLPEHVQGFVVKAILHAEVAPVLTDKRITDADNWPD